MTPTLLLAMALRQPEHRQDYNFNQPWHPVTPADSAPSALGTAVSSTSVNLSVALQP
jgi:hypothetical protein